MTRTFVSARGALGAAALAAMLLAAPSAQAQVGNLLAGALQSGDVHGGIGSGKNPDDQFRKPAPAPSLPGARSTPDRAAPSDKLATDMQPNDALFDAVNRGDIAGVREALSRGAEVSAHNILGLTPIDLSVDLGHTSITFLLLSMRHAAPAGGQPAARTATAAAGQGRQVRRAPLAPVHRDGATQSAAMQAPPRPVAPRPAPRPQVMADDGGTPRPSVGFLGFGK
jgi:hypothetical protein